MNNTNWVRNYFRLLFILLKAAILFVITGVISAFSGGTLIDYFETFPNYNWDDNTVLAFFMPFFVISSLLLSYLLNRFVFKLNKFFAMFIGLLAGGIIAYFVYDFTRNFVLSF